MTKPIEATPILRGQDASEFLKSTLDKKPTIENELRRKKAYSLLQRVTK